MNTIWLIVEGKKDGDIVRSILKKRYPHIRVRVLEPTGHSPSVSRLAAQVETLLRVAIQRRDQGDCIAILHDADTISRPHNRQDYERIAEAHRRHVGQVKLVIAKDEIESWLLADEGLAGWLLKRAGNYDEREKPSEILNGWLDSAGKPKFRLENLLEILSHMNGTGDRHSPSLRDALALLDGAPCARTPTP